MATQWNDGITEATIKADKALAGTLLHLFKSEYLMNRRDFLKRLGLVTAGVVAADQLEIIEKLGWKRRFFASVDLADPYKIDKTAFMYKEFSLGFMVTHEMLEDDIYGSLKDLKKKMNVHRSFMNDTYIFIPKASALVGG